MASPGGCVAVVGAGLKAPGGTSVEELWASLCAGRSHAQRYDDERLPPGADLLVCRVTGFDPGAYLSPIEVRRLDRSHALAIGAAQDALDPCLADGLPPPERCAVVCGVGLGAAATYEEQHARLLESGVRAMSPLSIPLVMPSSVAAHLSLRFGFRGPTVTVSAACASGAAAIGEGVELLRRGAADLVLAGGVDSLLAYGALSGFLRLDVMSRNVCDPAHASRPFDVGRDGFVMGEGAGFLVLQRLADSQASGRARLGLVLGHASNSDAHHLVAPSPEGQGAAECIRLALDDAGVPADRVGHVNAHGTSTQLNDLAESAALVSVFGPEGPPVTAVKGMTGHMIAGSGSVEAIVTLWSLRHALAPPVAGVTKVDPRIGVDVVTDIPRPLADGPALSSSFGFGGANTCLVLGS